MFDIKVSAGEIQKMRVVRLWLKDSLCDVVA